MSPEAKRRVIQRVTQSGALPVSRDAPGYAVVLAVLGVVDRCEGTGRGGGGRGADVVQRSEDSRLEGVARAGRCAM